MVDAPLSSVSAPTSPNATVLEIHPPPAAAAVPVRMRSASSSVAVLSSTHAAEPQTSTAPPSRNRSGSLKLSPTPTTVFQVFSSSVTTEVSHLHRPAQFVSDSAPDPAPLLRDPELLQDSNRPDNPTDSQRAQHDSKFSSNQH